MRKLPIVLSAVLLVGAAERAPGTADLARAYPNAVRAVSGTTLMMTDGTRWPLSDGIADKTPADRLARPDIDDMFVDRYSPGVPTAPPEPDHDPGRVRFQPLFTAMYGDCRKGQVLPRLRPVAWLPRHGGGTVMATSANGVADRLAEAVAELDRLPAPLIAHLVPNAGTYVCRPIAGTTAMSMHSYGAAIDISTARADYWRWSRGGYRNRIPWEIVAIFERHGFIWGGKWAHFDTMHFEYRPELLPPTPARAD